MIYKGINESNNKPTETEMIITCECSTHMLIVQEWREKYDTEIPENNNHRQTFDLAIFQYGLYPAKKSIRRRLSWAWKFLTTGKLFCDEIIMTPKDASKLANFIIERIENIKKEETEL